MKRAMTWPEGWGLLLLGIAAITIVMIGIVVSYDPIARAAAALAPDQLPVPCDATCELNRFDLNAQQHMAMAAWAMVGVALVGTVATIASLVFLWRTVQYSRTAAMAAIENNRVAQDAFVNENRAWIKVDIEDVASPLSWTEESGQLTLIITARNVGKTPALSVDLAASLEPQNMETHPRDERDHIAANATVPGWGYTIFPGDEIRLTFSASISIDTLDKTIWARWREAGSNVRFALLRIKVQANYLLAIGGQPRVTARFWEVTATPLENSQAIGPDYGDTSPERLRLVRSMLLDTVAT